MSNYVHTGPASDALRLGAALIRKEADRITEQIAKLERDRRALVQQEIALDKLWRLEKAPPLTASFIGEPECNNPDCPCKPTKRLA